MSTPVIDEPSERIPFSNLSVLQAVAVIAQMHDTSCSAGYVHPLKAPECSDVHLRFNWMPMDMEPLKLHGIEAWLRFDTRQWICLRQGSVFYLRRRDDAPPGLSHPKIRPRTWPSTPSSRSPPDLHAPARCFFHAIRSSAPKPWLTACEKRDLLSPPSAKQHRRAIMNFVHALAFCAVIICAIVTVRKKSRAPDGPRLPARPILRSDEFHPEQQADEIYIGTVPVSTFTLLSWTTKRLGQKTWPETNMGGCQAETYPVFVKRAEIEAEHAKFPAGSVLKELLEQRPAP